ncbi:interferon phi 1 [Entelurus aequoreus]|uniref:interferon phi 1 n=1 Tax=Entelurus aequoreus TaxID=161455 RepID=UPI002B1D24C5|nr:interferon phi 1 [Entelurus aequoreus]
MGNQTTKALVKMSGNLAVVCVLLLSLVEAAPVLKCRWSYGKYYQTSVRLLDRMAANATEDVENPLPFPKDEYELESKHSLFGTLDVIFFLLDVPHRHVFFSSPLSQVEHRLTFVAHLLQEVQDLFDHENISSASWDETTLEHFLAVVYRERDDLQDCVSGIESKQQPLREYFKELSRMVLEEKEYSAEAWEMIRKEVKSHLFRATQLFPSSHLI